MPMSTFVNPEPMDWDSVMPEGMKTQDTLAGIARVVERDHEKLSSVVEQWSARQVLAASRVRPRPPQKNGRKNR